MLSDQDKFVALQREHWGEVAPSFDKGLSKMTDACIRPLLGALGDIAGKRVLEIGCGPGHATVEAARRGAKIVATDLAPGMVEFSSRALPDLDFRVANAQELPFEDNSFDAAFGSFVIMLVPRPERAIEELTRVLKPGGRLALCAWDELSRNRVLGMLEEAKATAGLQVEVMPGAPDPWRFADDAEFKALLSDHGFNNVTVSQFEFTFEAAGAAALFDRLERESASLKAALARGDVSSVDRVRAAFLRLGKGYEHGSTIRVPCSAKIASGRAAAK
jgi:ubiquinone/menaquinone biosynthesis C-methylase UbiE